ncbi:MAG: TolC family protein [Pseudomonadales bacterium]
MTTIPRISCVWLLLWMTGSALAQGAPVGDERSISIEEALSRTLESHPGLVAAGYEIKVLEGREQQARLALNPELTIEVQDVAGSDAFQNFRSAESTISLAWIFERGVRQRRTDAASAGVSLAAMDADLLRVDTAAETARRFLRVLHTQSLADISAESVQLAEDTVAAVERRVEAGRAPQADLQRARANLASARSDLRDVEYEWQAARMRLAVQWGSTRPNFRRAAADPLNPPDPEPYPHLLSRLDQSPELVRYLSQMRLDEAEVRLAEARRKPAWQARLGVRRLEATDDHALVAGVTIPLAFRNRNQGNVAAARASVEKTRAESAAARVRAETTLSVLYDALERSRSRANSLENDVLPPLRDALTETRSAYERGRYSFFEWTAVQAEVIDAQRRLLAAGIESYQYAIEIERLTGVQLTEMENQP